MGSLFPHIHAMKIPVIYVFPSVAYKCVFPAGAGGSAPPARRWGGGGIKLHPLYFSPNISATPKRRNAELCTHLPEYLAEVVSTFDADPVSHDVTVTSEVRV